MREEPVAVAPVSRHVPNSPANGGIGTLTSMGENTIHDAVAAQFGPNAAAYVTSPTHSDEPSLQALIELVRPCETDELLDVATGAGHTALAFAPQVRNVVALDLTPAMLREAEKLARERSITNLSVREGRAEEMPFPDESFDLVTVRTAPHHFADVSRFLKEALRVLRGRGKLLVVDTSSPEDKRLDEQLNRIERLRDPSHVRNYTPTEWIGMAEKAGFLLLSLQVGRHALGKKMEVHRWMDRIGTPAENRSQILGAFENADPDLIEALELERREDEVWFSLPEITMLCAKA